MKQKLPLLALLWGVALLSPALAADAAPEAPLLDRAREFVVAFGKGDSAAVANFWMPEGDYLDLNGRHLVGREAISKSFAEFFAAHPKAKLRIDVDAIRFLDPNTAVEDGVTTLVEDGPIVSLRYTNIHVLKDGQWFLASVREYPDAEPGTGQHLQPLAWMIGAWQDENTGGETGSVEFTWAPGGNFLLAHHTLGAGGQVVSEGDQRIGWDAATGEVRSWSFEADGSFGEGTWTQKGGTWTNAMTSTLADGKKLSASNIITVTGPDAITWQSKDRKLDDKPLPDTPVIQMKRIP